MNKSSIALSQGQGKVAPREAFVLLIVLCFISGLPLLVVPKSPRLGEGDAKLIKRSIREKALFAIMKWRISFLESPFQVCLQQATAGPRAGWLALKCSAYSVAHVVMRSSGRQVCPSLYGNQPSVKCILGCGVRRQLHAGWSSRWLGCCASAVWLCLRDSRLRWTEFAAEVWLCPIASSCLSRCSSEDCEKTLQIPGWAFSNVAYLQSDSSQPINIALGGMVEK